MKSNLTDRQQNQYLKEMELQGYSADVIDEFHRVMVPYLLRRYGIEKSEVLAEIGSAQGHCLLSAHHAGYRNLVAIDCSDYRFDVFQANYGIRCFKVDVANEKLPLEDFSVGAFLFFHTIEHLSDAHFCLSEILRALKPGGWVFIVTPDWRKQYKEFYADPTHVRPYDKVSLSRILRIVGWKTIVTSSWGSRFGLGRLGVFRFFPKTGMIGCEILAAAKKDGGSD